MAATPTGANVPTTSTAGILRPRDAATRIDLRRYPAPTRTADYVERYWAVHWDLRDRDPYTIELVPHPCVNLTVTPEGAYVHGVGTRKSLHPLAGAGSVFGAKFRPGGFAAGTAQVAAALTDRSVPAREVFGPAVDDVAASVLATSTDEERQEVVDAFLYGQLPAPGRRDDAYDLVLRTVADLLADRTLTRVDHVARRFGVSARTLQRLYRRYVGVGPKWVIRRYRMHDVAERLANDEHADPAALAVELGWFDQAHFTRDFTALIGASPAEYAAACAASGDREPMALV